MSVTPVSSKLSSQENNSSTSTNEVDEKTNAIALSARVSTSDVSHVHAAGVNRAEGERNYEVLHSSQENNSSTSTNEVDEKTNANAPSARASTSQHVSHVHAAGVNRGRNQAFLPFYLSSDVLKVIQFFLHGMSDAYIENGVVYKHSNYDNIHKCLSKGPPIFPTAIIDQSIANNPAAIDKSIMIDKFKYTMTNFPRTMTLQELRQCGPEVNSTAEFQLNLSNSDVSDAELESIVRRFPNISALYANNVATLTNRGLEHISRLTGLTSLGISNCRGISDDGLKPLSSLINLEWFDLSECSQITGDGFEHISRLKNLKSLYLFGYTGIKEEKFRHLSSLTNLEILNLLGCSGVTNYSLMYLSPLINIRELNLSNCSKITTAGLGHLSGMTKLERLSLFNCDKITDSDIEDFKHLDLLKFTNLTDLNLSYTGITGKFFWLLRKSLPNLTILNLSGCKQFKNAGLVYLNRCQPTKLIDLDLSDCGITEEGLEGISQVTSLRRLNLFDCNIDEFEHISSLINLEDLWVSGRQIGDYTLTDLSPLINLKKLRFTGCDRLTDAGINKHLSKLINLIELSFTGCRRITQEGKDRLRNTLKNIVSLS